MGINKRHNPLILVTFVILGLLALALVPEDISISGYKLKKIDMLSDIRNDTSGLYIAHLNNELKLAEKEDPAPGYKILKDGTLSTPGEDASSNERGLSVFINSLQNKEYQNKPIHIAYYGDSEIEGDMITQDLRDLLQKQYGGKGAGFLPVWSVDSDFRTCSKPRAIGEWEHSVINQERTGNKNFGISGGVFNVINSGTAEFRSLKSGYSFNTVKLFYSAPDSIPVAFPPSNFVMLDNPASGSHVKELVFKSSQLQKSVSFTFSNPRINVYGASLESGNGIYIDNFTLRGHSGTGLTRIPYQNLSEFSRLIDYRLIVLHFGMNVLSESVKDYSYYEKKMIRVIQHFQSAFPNAGIVVIGVGDKGTKIGEEYMTDLSVLKLISAQKRAAAKTNSGFFNSFKAMGGANSMSKWVAKGLASKDYIHINRSGAKIIARSLFRYIISQTESADVCYKQTGNASCVN